MLCNEKPHKTANIPAICKTVLLTDSIGIETMTIINPTANKQNATMDSLFLKNVIIPGSFPSTFFFLFFVFLTLI